MAFSSDQLSAEPRVRVESVDVLRGLVMVIMALDHTREFFSNYGANPLDAERASGIMFFTRWITHLCAPTFVFLAGTSIYLQSLRKPRPQLARFLATRGLWLMVAELVVVSSM
ncbi:MAG: heparan-alpha-glucosaminide N-acetyltransferase domain-containing protein, partial [Verrucomicrobiota bacterium]|nr:heparan-alpha-glucosaminide N-acetyltransferase domain-containing protein [Verrucomicrobiota bacterium]